MIHFWQFVMCKECSSGVGILDINEMKRVRFTLAIRWPYKNEPLIKLSRASF